MIFEYGLVGNPLKHSLSKVIHEHLFKLKKLDFEYKLIETDDIMQTYDNILHHLKGFNVTIPYKRKIIMFLDIRSDKVRLYDSCNTVYINEKGQRVGENTDGVGFLDTLSKNHINMEYSRVLVLGSGGVSRMMAFEAVLAGADCYIYSRNRRACEELKSDIKRLTHKEVTLVELKEINNNFDCVFNGTPCGMYGNPFSSPIELKKIWRIPFIFDAIYNPRNTLLTSVANYMGNVGETGFYMLVSQAAKAQEYFTKNKFSVEEIEKIVKKTEPLLDNVILNKNIILIGAPGSGKSTIANELAKILNCKIIDIDKKIEEKEESTVVEIFKEKGESYFREVERKIFFESCLQSGNIISTGAGIVETTPLSRVARSKNIIVYLDVDKNILLKRLENSNSRPLLIGNTEEKLNDILARRRSLYEEYAHVKVNISDEQDIKKTTICILDRILENEQL